MFLILILLFFVIFWSLNDYFDAVKFELQDFLQKCLDILVVGNINKLFVNIFVAEDTIVDFLPEEILSLSYYVREWLNTNADFLASVLKLEFDKQWTTAVCLALHLL